MHRSAVVLSLACLIGTASAAEGMWTLDNLPRETLRSRYDFAPDQHWLDHVMKSAVRLAGGCSASFVSRDGLVLSNHHCIVDCLSKLSSTEDDLLKDGFLAATRAEERICPGMELNRLEAVSDVTARISKATAGLAGADYNAARKAEQSRIEAECIGDAPDSMRCDVVELYQGGLQHLYRYTRFQEARLVFAPEYSIGFFGGDPDNFSFPRYNLDMSLLRAYENGKPARVADYFRLDPKGAEPGELVMTLGHPGTTQRLLTVSQLLTQRDVVLPFRLLYGAEYRGLITRYRAESAENARITKAEMFGVENGLKARRGLMQTLLDSALLDAKRKDEQALRAFVDATPERRARYGDPWASVDAAQKSARELYLRYTLIEVGFGFTAEIYGHARSLVRAAAERGKSNEQRLREYTESALPSLERRLLAETPIYPEYEKLKLGWSLTKLREHLGVSDALVREVLGRESPQTVAERLIDGSRLGDAAVRKALWQGGAAAIDASEDPMIVFARRIDAAARALRTRYENEVEAVEKRAAESLAAARFAHLGTSVYPDATFSLRLSHGVIEGWEEQGAPVAPFTNVDGLFLRRTDFEPFALPPRWIEAEPKLDGATRFNLVSSNDVIGGNSGSPLIDREARIVGLVFDGNIHSLGGAYHFDARVNRTVSVHPAAMLAALEYVYEAEHLLAELGAND